LIPASHFKKAFVIASASAVLSAKSDAFANSMLLSHRFNGFENSTKALNDLAQFQLGKACMRSYHPDFQKYFS